MGTRFPKLRCGAANWTRRRSAVPHILRGVEFRDIGRKVFGMDTWATVEKILDQFAAMNRAAIPQFLLRDVPRERRGAREDS